MATVREMFRGEDKKEAGLTWQLSTAANLHHGTHSIHMVLPSFGIEDQAALDLREAWHWPSVTWDLLGAAVALYYLSLRAATPASSEARSCSRT